MNDYTVIISLNDGEEIVRDYVAESVEDAILTAWDDFVGYQVADIFVENTA